jgi:hypothetical protein
MMPKQFIKLKKELFFAPRLFVDIGKCNFAIAGVDAFDSCLAFRIKIAFGDGTVRKFDLVLLVGDGLTRLIEQLDFNPVTGLGCGRTCRVR